MNVTEFLLEVRDTLNDPFKSKWGDSELVRTGDRMVRTMARKLAEVTGSNLELWHNVQDTEFREIYKTVFEAKLPDWTLKLMHLNDRNPDEGADKNSSPYLVLNGGVAAPETLSTTIHVGSAELQDRFGAMLTEHKTLRVYGPTAARNMTVRLSKRPSRMFQATLDLAGLSTTQFYMPVALTLGTLETEVGAYRNTIFQFGTTEGTHGAGVYMAGDTRVCVQSDPKVDVSGARRDLVTVDRALSDTPAVGDTFETLLEIPDEHCRRLILEVAYASSQKHSDRTLQRSLEADLATQREDFNKHVQPRQLQEPTFMKRRHRSRKRNRNRNDPVAGWGY